MSRLFEKVRNLYGYATAYDANQNVPKHLRDIRVYNLEEFDRMIDQVKADAWEEGHKEGWDECWMEHTSYGMAPTQAQNPYRKEQD